jgi:Cu+-exporting ATPase
VFDKTGTLTHGKLQVTDFKLLDPRLFESDFLYVVGSAESASEHPIAVALTKLAASRIKLTQPTDFEAIPGQGIRCTVDSRKVLIGTRQLIISNQMQISESLNNLLISYEDQANTAVIVAVNNEIVGVIAVADTVKEEAAEAIASLKSLGIDDIWIVSGDNYRVAKAVATQVNKIKL